VTDTFVPVLLSGWGCISLGRVASRVFIKEEANVYQGGSECLSGRSEYLSGRSEYLPARDGGYLQVPRLLNTREGTPYIARSVGEFRDTYSNSEREGYSVYLSTYLGGITAGGRASGQF